MPLKTLRLLSLACLGFVCLISTACRPVALSEGLDFTEIKTPARASSTLDLRLTAPDGSALQDVAVQWRPVFASSQHAAAGRGQTDAQGHLVLNSLWPEIRYLIEVEQADGQRLRRWYQPLEPVVRWEWVVSAEDALIESSDETSVTFEPADVTDLSVSQLLIWADAEETHDFDTLRTQTTVALGVTSERTSTPTLERLQMLQAGDILWCLPRMQLSFPESGAGHSQRAYVEQMVRFVESGGTLVMSGEWAGMGGGHSSFSQALGERFGFQVSQDTLAQAEETLSIENIHDHPLTEGVAQLILSRSGSVAVRFAHRTEELAFAPSAHYRIARQAADETLPLEPEQTVLALIHWGKGRVVVLGDSSLWDNERLMQADNWRLWQNIVELR